MNLLLSRNPSVPIQPQCGENVEDDVCPHDSKITPSGRVLRVELCQVDIGVSSSAEFAIRCGVFVGKVTTCCIDIGGHVLEACLAGGRVELDEFNGRADDGIIGQAGGEHTVDEVGERGYSVHEDPETRECGGTCEDTGKFVSIGFPEDGERIRGLPAKDQC